MFKGSKYLLPALLKTVILPPLIALFLFHLPLPHPLNGIINHAVFRICLYIASWPLIYVLRTKYSLYRSSLSARNLGAREIERVKGRWWMNLDVMVDWSRSGREEEVGRMLVLLGRKYGGVYNTRVLGEDQVSIWTT